MFLLLFCSYIYALPLNSRADRAKIYKSKITNAHNGGISEALDQSTVNRGIKGKGAYISESYISNSTEGNIYAENNSVVNTGINADNSTIMNSRVSVSNKGDIDAYNSKVNTGVNVRKLYDSEVEINHRTNINAVNFQCQYRDC